MNGPSRLRDDSSRRILELDGIRGFAVGLVLLHHFWPNVGLWRIGLPLAEVGWIGVDLFFVLSGFLITGILLDTADRPDYFRRFYIRRSFRIFPLYYAFLISIFGFLAFWRGGSELSRFQAEWGSPVWFFVYLANCVSAAEGIFPIFGPLGPPWSLQIEEQFYVVFPAVVRFLKTKLWAVLSGIMIASLLWRSAGLLYAPGNPMLQYVGSLSRMDALAAGGLATLLLRRMEPDFLRRVIRWVAPLALACLVLLYICSGTEFGAPVTRSLGYSLNAVAFAALILWVVERRNESAAAPFRWGPAAWLGQISYGVYLLQLPVQAAVKMLMRAPMGRPERLPLDSLTWLVATLALAWLSWRWFESPLQRFGHRLTTIETVSAEVPSPPRGRPRAGASVYTR